MTSQSDSMASKATIEDATGSGLDASDPKTSVDAEKTPQTFLEKHGRDLHPALDASQSDSNTSEGVKKASVFNSFKDYHQVETGQFYQAVEAYQDSWQDPQIRALSVRQHTSWEQVMQAARDAEDKYMLAGQTKWRKWARTVTDKSMTAIPFVRMLPNNSTFWPAISGGLRLFFEICALSKIGERREDVLRSLIRIPQIILQAEEACANFGPDNVLNVKAEKLYVAALAALEGAIKWLTKCQSNRSTALKPLRAIALGPLYNKSFEEKIASLDDCLDALESHVSILRDTRICRIDSGVKTLHTDVNHHMEQLHLASKTAIEKMKEVLADSNRQAKWMKQKEQDIRRLKLRVEELEQANSALTEADLLDILNVVKTHPALDLQQINRRTDPDSPESHEALGVAASDQFKLWHEEDSSLALFIEGGRPISLRRVSSLTLVSSQIISRYSDSPHAAAIYFFCGHHDNPTDSLSGPLGMLRSLINQLLQTFPVNLDFISIRLRPLLEKLNLRALCECFSKLVKQIPASAVIFCIIDGISFFETRQWIDDTIQLMRQLHWLVNDSDTKAIFKLLVTSPARSKDVKNIFEPEDQMSLLGSGSRRRPTERDIMMAKRRSPRLQPRYWTTGSDTALSGQELEHDLRRYTHDAVSDSDDLSAH